MHLMLSSWMSVHQILHRHRVTSAGQRGGGLALVRRDIIKATTIHIGIYTSSSHWPSGLPVAAPSPVVVYVYRPPGTVISTFTDQLADMLNQIVLLSARFVVVVDLNAPGIASGQLDPHAVDMFSQYGLCQHVTGPTHASGNALDLILSHDEQINQQLITNVAVQSVCFSDHHLLT